MALTWLVGVINPKVKFNRLTHDPGTYVVFSYRSTDIFGLSDVCYVIQTALEFRTIRKLSLL